MVEIFFGIITRQAIRRGTTPLRQRSRHSHRRVHDAYNERCTQSPGPRTPTNSREDQAIKVRPSNN
jgi:hypothetical protein